MVGSEMPTNSQQIRWAEQQRLHVFYEHVYRTGAATNVLKIKTQAAAGSPLAGDGGDTQNDDDTHAIRLNDKLLIGTDTATAELFIVTNVSGADISVHAYAGATADTTGTVPVLTAIAADEEVSVNILVIGSEVGKGSDSRAEHIQPEYGSYTNNPNTPNLSLIHI